MSFGRKNRILGTTALVASPLLVAAALAVPALGDPAVSYFARHRTVAAGERVPSGYEVRGVHLGGFTLYPSLDAALTGNNNIYYDDTNKVSATVASLDPAFRLNSNWGRHALSASLTANYDGYSGRSSENTLAWDAAAGGRLDFGAFSNVNAGADFAHNYEPRFDPASPRNSAKPIQYDMTTARLGTVVEFNRVRLTGTLDYQKLDYANGRDTSGNLLLQDQRDYTRTGYTARADYALSPLVSLFATYGHNQREYRISTLNRDSHGYTAALGASFDLTDLMNGEIQYGYLEQTYKNPAFKPSKGGTLKARLSWYPTRLTTVTVTSNREVGETPDVAASGILTTNSGIEVNHELLRTLVLTGSYGHIDDRYNGVDRRDRRNTIGVKGTYLLSPTVAIKAGYTHSDLTSHGAAAIHPYKDDAVTVAVSLKY